MQAGVPLTGSFPATAAPAQDTTNQPNMMIPPKPIAGMMIPPAPSNGRTLGGLQFGGGQFGGGQQMMVHTPFGMQVIQTPWGQGGRRQRNNNNGNGNDLS